MCAEYRMAIGGMMRGSLVIVGIVAALVLVLGDRGMAGHSALTDRLLAWELETPVPGQDTTPAWITASGVEDLSDVTPSWTWSSSWPADHGPGWFWP